MTAMMVIKITAVEFFISDFLNSTTGIAIPGGHRDLSQGLNSLHCVGGHANSQGIAACCVDAVKRIQMKN